MKKSQKGINIKKAIIIYISSFTLITFAIFLIINNKDVFFPNFQLNSFLEMLKSAFLTTLIINFPIIFMALFIYFIFIGIAWGSNKAKFEYIKKINFSREKEYYREILKKYSPIVLTYIDNFKIEKRKDLISILLVLKLKKKIQIEKNKLIIIDTNVENLTKVEKYIIDNIQNGKLELPHFGYINTYVEEEAVNDGLIIKAEYIKEKTAKKKRQLIIMGIIIFIIQIIIIITPFNLSLINFFVLGISSFGEMIYLLIAIPYYFSYCYMANNSYKRTSKGKEINLKLEGLKNYLKEFNNLDDKQQNDLIIWEEYLIYSVMFNLNKSIVEDMKDLIIIGQEVGKMYFSR